MKVLNFEPEHKAEMQKTLEEKLKARDAFFAEIQKHGAMVSPTIVAGYSNTGEPVIHMVAGHPMEMAMMKHVVVKTLDSLLDMSMYNKPTGED